MIVMEMVVMEKNKRGGGEDGGFVAVVVMFVKDGEVVIGIVAGMVARDVAGVEGAGPKLRVVVGLSEDSENKPRGG